MFIVDIQTTNVETDEIIRSDVETFPTQENAELYRMLQQRFGRCVKGKIEADVLPHATRRQTGWIFERKVNGDIYETRVSVVEPKSDGYVYKFIND